MKSKLRFIVPVVLWRYIHEIISGIRRRFKSPHMIWGYRDSTGEWRDRTRISDTAFINHRDKIRIADNVFVGHYSILDGTGGLEIGEGCQLAGWNGIYTHSSHIAIRLLGVHYTEVPEDEKTGFTIAPVRLGEYVFLGAGAKIFPGVTIGKGALIGAGTIVNENVDTFAIVAGIPSKVIGDTREMDKVFLDDPKIFAWYQEWQKG